jgi:hypothetical protein
LELSSAEQRIIRSKRRCLTKGSLSSLIRKFILLYHLCFHYLDIQSVELSVKSIPKREISYSASNKSDNSSNEIIPILDVDVSNSSNEIIPILDVDVSNDDISKIMLLRG